MSKRLDELIRQNNKVRQGLSYDTALKSAVGTYKREAGDQAYSPVSYRDEGNRPYVPTTVKEYVPTTRRVDEKPTRKSPTIFGLQTKPVWNLTGKDLLDDLKYTAWEFVAGTAKVAGAIANVPDAAHVIGMGIGRAASNATSYLYSKITGKEYKPSNVSLMTATKVYGTLAKRAVGIETVADKYKGDDVSVKRILTDVDKGNNLLLEMNKRTEGYYLDKAQVIEPNVSKAMQVTSKVVSTLPQMSLMMLPHGQVIFSLAAYGGEIGTVTTDGKVAPRDLEFAIYKANVEVGTEMIFGLFGNSEALLQGALARAIKSGTPISVAMLIKAVGMQGIEEGLEEVIGFPFSIYLDMKYKDPSLTVQRFLSKETWTKDMFLQWGEAALVGFLAGALMTVPQARNINRTSTAMINQGKLRQHIEKIMSKDIDDITIQDAQETADLAEQAIAETGPPLDVEQFIKEEQQAEAGETFIDDATKDYSDLTRFIKPQGTPIQQGNIQHINELLSPIYDELQTAVDHNDEYAIGFAQMKIDTLKNKAKKVADDIKYNPYKIKATKATAPDTDVPFDTAAPTTPQTEVPVQRPPAKGKTTGQRLVKKTRADFPDYLGWLEHQLGVTNAKINSPNTPTNVAKAIANQKIPQLNDRISAEREAMANGTTTEKVKNVKKPKEAKKNGQPENVQNKNKEDKRTTATEETGQDEGTVDTVAGQEGVQQGESGSGSTSVPVIFKQTKGAKTFHKAITEAVATNSHGAFVEAKSLEEYSKKGTELFISLSGQSGFALTSDGDLVSLFKKDGTTDANVLHEAMVVGIANGAKKLDCFDGFLPTHYAQYGFVAVAQVAFNDEFAPPNWNYERDGKPSVVFMVHNGDSIEQVRNKMGNYPEYDPTSVPLVSYDEAVSIQTNAMEAKKQVPNKKRPNQKPTAKVQTTVEDNAVLKDINNETTGNYEFVPTSEYEDLQRISSAFEDNFGVKTLFVKSTTDGYEREFDAFYNSNSKHMYLDVSAQQLPKDILINLFGHEFTHAVNGMNAQSELANTVLDILNIHDRNDAREMANAIARLRRSPKAAEYYNRVYGDDAPRMIDELVATYAGISFGNNDFLKKLDSYLGEKSEGVFTKLFKWLRTVVVSKKTDNEFATNYLKQLDAFLQTEHPDLYSQLTEKKASKGKVKDSTKPTTTKTTTKTETVKKETPPVKKRTPVSTGDTTDTPEARTFFSEPRTINKDTIKTFDKAELITGLKNKMPEIQRLISKNKGKIIADISMNIINNKVLLGSDFFGTTATKESSKGISTINFNAMVDFYDKAGLGKFSRILASSAIMMNDLNTIHPDDYAKSHSEAMTKFFTQLFNAANGNDMNNLYVRIGESMSIPGALSIPFSVDNVKSGQVVLTEQTITPAKQKKYNLSPFFEHVPVDEDIATEEPTKVEVPKTTAKTESTFERARYDEANVDAWANTDKDRYVVKLSTYVDEERKDLLNRLGFKLNTHDHTYGKPIVKGMTMDKTLAKLIEGLVKIERASVIIESNDSKPDIETSEDGKTVMSFRSPKTAFSVAVNGGNKKAMDNIDGAMQFKEQSKNKSLVKDLQEWSKEMFTRGALPKLSRSIYGHLRLLLLQNLRSSNIAASMAEQYISLYNQLTPDQYKKAMRVIVLRDILDDIKNNRIKDMNKLPWEFANEEEVFAETYKAEQEAKADPIIMTIVKARKGMLESVRTLYKKQARICGYDASILFTHEEYMHHSMQDIADAITSVKSGSNTLRSSWLYEQRNNANKPYLTDPALSDYITMHQMFKDIKRMELLEEVKRHDKSKQYKRGTKLPEGYVETNVGIIGFTFPEEAMKVHLIELATAQADILGITGKEKQIFIDKAGAIQAETRLVLPVEMATTFKALLNPNPKNAAEKAYSKAVRQWKILMLKWPHRIINYNVRNFVGDLDALLAAHPGAVKYIWQSYQELYAFYNDKTIEMKDGETVRESLLPEYIWNGGLTTGLSEVEFSNFQRYPKLTFYDKSFQSGDPRKVVDALKSTFGAHGKIEIFTQFREQLLRYADFLYLMNDSLNNPDMVPVVGKGKFRRVDFGASVPTEIMGIRTKAGRAAKMANDDLGAYDDVSLFASWMSDNAIPFFRFKWINPIRYFRLFRNVFLTDEMALGKSGLAMANKLGVVGRIGTSAALRLGRLVATGSIITLIQALVNTVHNLGDDEQEEDLPDYIKDSIHLYLFKLNGRSYYYTGLGAIGDLSDFLGIDTGIADFKNLVEGRMSIKEYATQQALAPMKNTLDQMFPLLKMISEPVTGMKTFPQLAPIRNIPEHIFASFGFKDIYRSISKMPDKQLNIFQRVFSLFGNSSETEYSVYWQAKELVDNYTIDSGKTPYVPSANISPKGNSIYYFKEAIRLGDKQSAVNYLAQYIANGGTRETYDASMEYMNPMNQIKKSERDSFYNSLEGRDKEIMDRAIALYDKMINEGESVASGKFDIGSTSSDAIPDELKKTIESMRKKIGG